MYPTVLSYLVYSVPIFQSNCCTQRKQQKQKQKTNDKHGTWLIQKYQYGYVNTKRPLLLESHGKRKTSNFSYENERWELQIREAFFNRIKGEKKKSKTQTWNLLARTMSETKGILHIVALYQTLKITLSLWLFMSELIWRHSNKHWRHTMAQEKGWGWQPWRKWKRRKNLSILKTLTRKWTEKCEIKTNGE